MNVMHIDPAKITIPPRQRKDLGSLTSLKESIKKYGQLHPITLRKEGDKLILVAGERRLQSCMQLGIPVAYVLLEELSPLEHIILELRENLDRKELSPAERAEAICLAHERLCEANKDRPKPWSYRDTAKALGISAASVSDAIGIANSLEVLKGTDADVTKMTQTELRNAARRTSKVKSLVKKAQKVIAKKQGSLLERGSIHIGNAFELPLEDTFDLVLTDPPWQIEYKKQSTSRLTGSLHGTHYDDTEGAVQDTELFKLFHRLLKPNGILLTFCPVAKFGLWHFLAQHVGFLHVFSVPLVWIKGSRCTQPNPHLYPGSSLEFILLAHKGPESTLQVQGRPNWIMIDPVPAEQQIHPAEKPVALFTWLLEMACPIGGTMIDPFAGSGASLRAAFLYGCSRFVGIEINEKAVELAWAKLVELEKEKEQEDGGNTSLGNNG